MPDLERKLWIQVSWLVALTIKLTLFYISDSQVSWLVTLTDEAVVSDDQGKIISSPGLSKENRKKKLSIEHVFKN